MTHRCHAIRCAAPCAPSMLMCRACWGLVTPATQREVYRTVKLRRGARPDASWAAWWRASERALVENGVAREVFTPVGAVFWTEKAEAFAEFLETQDHEKYRLRLDAARAARDAAYLPKFTLLEVQPQPDGGVVLVGELEVAMPIVMLKSTL